MKNNQRTRKKTIKQEKIYLNYFVTCHVKTDFKIDKFKDVYELIEWLEAQNRENPRRRKFSNSRTQLDDFLLIHSNFEYPLAVSGLKPLQDLFSKTAFVLENEKIEVLKAPYTVQYSDDEEEKAQEWLLQLQDENLIFDGYLYTSKYHQIFLLAQANVLRISGEYWNGDWKET